MSGSEYLMLLSYHLLLNDMVHVYVNRGGEIEVPNNAACIYRFSLSRSS